MKHTTYFSAALLLALVCIARAEDQPAVKLPAGAETASERLKASPRHGEWVDVAVGDVKVKTWVVYPEVKDKVPVIIVIHEIFGMTDWVRGVADQLAAEGFVAVAPDLLSGFGPGGGGSESLGDGVRQAIGKVTVDEQAKRLDAVREWAISQPASTDKCGVIGFCWGGSASFNYATHQPKLGAAVVYYGTPPKKEAMEEIACPVMGCYGGNDARVTQTVESAKAAMSELKKEYDPHVYDSAGHGFLRQQSGSAANLKAAQEAWPATVEFLRKNLK